MGYSALSLATRKLKSLTEARDPVMPTMCPQLPGASCPYLSYQPTHVTKTSNTFEVKLTDGQISRVCVSSLFMHNRTLSLGILTSASHLALRMLCCLQLGRIEYPHFCLGVKKSPSNRFHST